MNRLYSLIVIVAVTACANSVIYEKSAWPQYAYPGFSEKINALSSDDALDCGFYNFINGKGDTEKKLKKAFSSCVKPAVQSGAPFKVGSVQVPVDSTAYEVLLYTPDKQFWLITYDVMLDGSDAAHWIKRCESVTIDAKSLDYTGQACVDISTEEWLSVFDNQPT